MSAASLFAVLRKAVLWLLPTQLTTFWSEGDMKRSLCDGTSRNGTAHTWMVLGAGRASSTRSLYSNRSFDQTIRRSGGIPGLTDMGSGFCGVEVPNKNYREEKQIQV